MKEIKDDLLISIKDPFGGDDILFEINKDHNLSLALRLIRKRDKIKTNIRSCFDDLDDLRKKHNITESEKKSQEILEKINELGEDDFDDKEKFEKQKEKLMDKLLKLKDAFPQELLDLQNKIQNMFADVDRIGTSICSIVLLPVGKIPDEYPDKKSYLEEIIPSEKSVEEVISFFLSAYSSSTKSQTESEDTVKLLTRKQALKDLDGRNSTKK